MEEPAKSGISRTGRTRSTSMEDPLHLGHGRSRVTSSMWPGNGGNCARYAVRE